MHQKTAAHLIRPRTLADWLRIRRLYHQAFPATERKPFGIILRMFRQGRADVWIWQTDGRFAGFAATVNGGQTVLLDYFAVRATRRGQGVGSAFLRALMRHYEGKGVFVEIEAVDEQLPHTVRRRDFYLRCGMEDMHVAADVFGVKMELLGRGCTLTFSDYRAFYHDHYSPWAAEHITPVP